jgi:hypothetical protein
MAWYVFPGDKIIVFYTSFVNSVLQYRGLAESWDSARTIYMCLIDRLYPVPPPIPLGWYEGELCIYNESWRRIPQYSVLLWHTDSHLIIIISINNDISLWLHAARKSKLTLFRLSLCLFK